MLRALYTWMNGCVHKKYADLMLVVLFFFEALIFILPTDPMLIMYCIEQRNKAFWYASLATIGSVLGGITGYIIGYTVWQSVGEAIIHNQLVNIVITPKDFYYACELYQKHAYLAIFIAGFTPVPYKVATFTAGFCKIAFLPFVICSIIARGARFFLYAITITLWGKQIKQYIDRFFNLLVPLIVLLIAVSVWLCKH